MNHFEVKVSYEDDLTEKKVTEVYLVDAETFTDAEARMNEIMASRGTFTIDTVKKVKFAEFLLDDKSQRYFKAKVGFIRLDEKTMEEKKTYYTILIQADDLPEALKLLQQGLSDSMEDYEIALIQEKPYIEYKKYDDNK